MLKEKLKGIVDILDLESNDVSTMAKTLQDSFNHEELEKLQDEICKDDRFSKKTAIAVSIACINSKNLEIIKNSDLLASLKEKNTIESKSATLANMDWFNQFVFALINSICFFGLLKIIS